MNLTTIMLGYIIYYDDDRGTLSKHNWLCSFIFFCVWAFWRYNVIYLSLLQKGEVQKDFGWGNRIATWLYYVRFF